MIRIALGLSATLTLVAALSSAFFYTKVREHDAVLAHFTEQTLRGADRSDTTALVLAISREVHRRTKFGIAAQDLPLYERLESTSFFNVTSTVSLLYGTYGVIGHSTFGPCGTMTRTLLGALGNLGVPARKLQLLDNEQGVGGGHTVVEFLEGGRWRVVSPSDSTFVWRTRDGSIASVEDIQRDSSVFAQIFRRFPAYPYRFDNPSHIRWAKFPAPVRWAMRALLGEERYRDALTPALYEHPRLLLLYCSLAAFVLFGVTASILRGKATVADRHRPANRDRVVDPGTRKARALNPRSRCRSRARSRPYRCRARRASCGARLP